MTKEKVLNYLSKIDNIIYFILTFCLFGLIRNLIILKYLQFDYRYFNTKICVAMAVIYLVQILLILLRQRIVALISLIQALFGLFVFRDFTFLPLINLLVWLKNFLFPNLSYGWEYFLSFAFISLMLCLELIKTYLLYVLTDQLPKHKQKTSTEAA